MEKKITKKEMFEKLKAMVADNDEMVAFIDHEIELLVKKNSAPKKPTARQNENAELDDVVLNVLTDTEMTIAEIQALDERLADLSNQRLSAIISKLVDDNKAVRTIKKRKSYFTKA